MRKKKNLLPGGIPMTSKLKYRREHNFLEYIKLYQKMVLEKKATRA